MRKERRGLVNYPLETNRIQSGVLRFLRTRLGSQNSVLRVKRDRKRSYGEVKNQSYALSFFLYFLFFSISSLFIASYIADAIFPHFSFPFASIMNCNEGTNEGGSSPDTVIARSSSEEEKQKSIAASTSGEYITVNDSSSSLDTVTSGSVGILSLTGNTDDRKKSKLGAFKSSFREGNLFKIKKKKRDANVSSSFEAEHHDKGYSRRI